MSQHSDVLSNRLQVPLIEHYVRSVRENYVEGSIYWPRAIFTVPGLTGPRISLDPSGLWVSYPYLDDPNGRLSSIIDNGRVKVRSWAPGRYAKLRLSDVDDHQIALLVDVLVEALFDIDTNRVEIRASLATALRPQVA